MGAGRVDLGPVVGGRAPKARPPMSVIGNQIGRFGRKPGTNQASEQVGRAQRDVADVPHMFYFCCTSPANVPIDLVAGLGLIELRGVYRGCINRLCGASATAAILFRRRLTPRSRSAPMRRYGASIMRASNPSPSGSAASLALALRISSLRPRPGRSRAEC